MELLGQQVKERIDYKVLLDNISQEEVFNQFLGIYPNLYQKIRSPFRSNDKSPGCRFEWKNGLLCLVENTGFNGRIYWDIFKTVMFIKNCNFQEALSYIAAGRYSTVKSVPVYKPKLEIRFDTDIWGDNLFGLSSDILLSEYVYKVKNYYAGREGNWKKNFLHKNTLTIAYHFPKTDHVKLYWPLETENRWYSNCTNQDIFGLDLLNETGDLLIISKSQKDRLTLKYHYGYENVIAVQNEGCYIPENIMDQLKLRFNRVIVIFDNDDTGYDQAQKLSSKYGIEYRILELDTKDIYDAWKSNYQIYL